MCGKYLLHNNLLETYLSRSARYQDQPGLTSQILKVTQVISQPGLTPRFLRTHSPNLNQASLPSPMKLLHRQILNQASIPGSR